MWTLMFTTKYQIDMGLCVRNHILTDGNPYYIDNSTYIMMIHLHLSCRKVEILAGMTKTVYVWVEGRISPQEYQIRMISVWNLDFYRCQQKTNSSWQQPYFHAKIITLYTVCCLYEGPIHSPSVLCIHTAQWRHHSEWLMHHNGMANKDIILL